jgi:hypothetical protein
MDKAQNPNNSEFLSYYQEHYLSITINIDTHCAYEHSSFAVYNSARDLRFPWRLRLQSSGLKQAGHDLYLGGAWFKSDPGHYMTVFSLF